jgi:hypothetical protein
MGNAGAFTEFRRASVADQAAAALRDAIRQGAWGDLLPGEHELARRLNISRPSVRAALSRLAEDGVVTISKGRRTRVNVRTGEPAAGAPPTICLVVPSSRESLGLSGHPVLMEMRAQFAVLGIGWEEIFDRTLGGRHPEPRLASMVTGRRHVCWLLLGASATIQRWFQQARVPTLVLGSCHAGVELPSVDVDYFAIGWHASGCLAKAGHSRIAVVLPHRPLAGDLACLRGLTEYIIQRERPVSVVELTAGPSRTGLLTKLDSLLAKEPRPTAVFCVHVDHLLMVLVHLLRAGWKVPQQISLLCRETHTAVDLGLPEVTRYRSAAFKQAHQAVRVAQSMLAGHQVPTKPHLIMPAFEAGGTLANA